MPFLEDLQLQLPSWMGGYSDQEKERILNQRANESVDRAMATGALPQGAPIAPGQERMTIREGTLTPGGTRDKTLDEMIQQIHQQQNRNRTVVPNVQTPPRPQVPVQPAPSPAPQRPSLGGINGASVPTDGTPRLRRQPDDAIAVRG